MAELPQAKLTFRGRCPDCGERRVLLPEPLPAVGDDFDWQVRDYDGFRLFMLEQLAARFPERRRWTPADLEVVLVEALAAVLDQLSDMLDRVASEAFLETARRPESVRRLLQLIGYDAVQHAVAAKQISPAATDDEAIDKNKAALDAFWLRSPHAMEMARQAGPRSVHVQHRMVTVDDYARRLEDHPLVLRAHSWSRWTGSWTTIRVAVICWANHLLDECLEQISGEDEEICEKIERFHMERGLSLPDLTATPSIRAVLRSYIDAYRMVGQEVMLEDARPVGIAMALSLRLAENFFQSEMRRAVAQALGGGPEGFFRPGRLRFGEDLYASDVVQAVMAVDGVESVCLNRFKRLGSRFPDRSGSGNIVLDGLEVAVCDNDPAEPERGYYRLSLHGGRKG
ncbi:MAG: hypothetical protein GY856_18445 [bacterium]|nr:hypothetical protein [bacterium]